MKLTLAILVVFFLSALAFGQHEHQGMAMQQSTDARLQVRNDAAAQQLVLRLGPLRLPAHSDHTVVAQAPPLFLEVPFDGWMTGFHPRLIDAAGQPEPGRLLHHVAFYNAGRHDFLCPNKLEHIFGAGGEMNDWPPVPGYGYRVHPGDRVRITTMFHNPTSAEYPETYLEVKVDYRINASGQALKSVYPAWFDVQECSDSGYDLAAGPSQKSGEIAVNYPGVLLGVGGHLHDYGRQLDFVNVTRHEEIAKLQSKLDASGRLLSMPLTYFVERGGYKLNKGDVLKVTATYDNPTGKTLKEGAMGIIVGYFVPADETELAGLKK